MGLRCSSVFSPGVRLVGFTTTDWERLLSLFQPRRPSGEVRDADRPAGAVIGIHEGGKLVKLVHTRVGRLRLDEIGRGQMLSAELLARETQASTALLVERGVLDGLMERFAERLHAGQDLTEQLLALLEVVRREMSAPAKVGTPTLEVWPRRLASIPLPSKSMVDGVIESVCPADRAMVVVVFEAGELWTCLALRRDPSGFDLVLGPEELRADMGLLSRDWRRDYRHLARAVEDHTNARLSLGVFSEVSTLRRLEVDPAPGAWARAVAVRDVLLAPVPPALALPLGVDATRGAISIVRSVLERVDPSDVLGSTFGGTLQAAFDRVRETVPRGEPFRPLEILRLLLSRER